MPSGILIIDKTQGWTSMDVCAKLRGIFREKRIGHAGTLDPMATGVLPVFIGRATRAVEFASEGQKEYVAGLRLGLVTNTQDTSGEVLEERPFRGSLQDLEGVLDRFRGDIQQVPPMYSAIKINGKKLYELARKGREVERKPRPVTIAVLELLGQEENGDWKLRVESCLSEAGGGSLPGEVLPGAALTIEGAADGARVETLQYRLRMGEIPVIGYIAHGRLWLDMRTVFEEELPVLAECLREALLGGISCRTDLRGCSTEN